MKMVDVPVLMIVFNRPEHTRLVFERVACARPTRLFFAADGPRNPEEARLCAETRAIIEHVDWDCDVHTKYSDVNLGCRYGPITAFNWVFEHCDRAILFEDDCVPDPSFLPFCAELLERYCDDERIMAITGNNFRSNRDNVPNSYFFSRLPGNWGWATWRRAWSHFDVGIPLWKQLRETPWLEDYLGHKPYADYYRTVFDHVSDGTYQSCWDFQWVFAVWSQHALSIRPRVNLVSNIGFGKDSTHTRDESSPFGFIPAETISQPLSHPPCIVWNREADHYAMDLTIAPDRKSLYRRVVRKLNRMIPLRTTS
jgi:hypothetical protein